MSPLPLPAARPAAASMHGQSVGIALMLLAVMFIALIDPAAKLAGQTLPVLQVVWGRYAFASLTMLVLIRPNWNPATWGVRRGGLQTLRALLLIGSTGFNFLALQSLALVHNQAIVMLGPVVITFLSILLFRERVTALIGLALLTGLIGAMVVIRPTGGVFEISSLYAVGNVLSYAFYVLLSKILLKTESSASLNLVAVLIPTLILSGLVVPFWQWPATPGAWAALILVGIVGGLGHFLLIRAHAISLASTLAPLAYTQLCWAVAGGLLLFHEVPDATTLLGAAIICLSGGLIVLAKRQRRA